MKKLLALLVGVMAFAFYATPAFAQGETPTTGWIEICKASHGNPALTDTFSFTLSVPAVDAAGNAVTSLSAPVGACTQAVQVPAGEVTVTESPATMTNEPNGYGGQFSTYDYTAVTAIHTSAPGAQDAQLVAGSVDLTGRHATVVVNPSTYQTDETLVTFTNDPVQGYVEVCKTQTAGAGLDNLSFPFTIFGGNGFMWSGSITTGACSDPILVPAGHVIVQETGTQYVAGITSPNSTLQLRTGQTVNAVIDPAQVAEGWAAVSVMPNGTVSQESIVSFEDNMSQLKICKIAASADLVGQTYSFTVNGGSPISVVADPAPANGSTQTGHCVLAGSYPAGTAMTVTEAPTAGERVTGIALSDGRTFVKGGSDFVGVSASFTMGAGVETITYTNAIADPGMLKVCKFGPAGEPAATFVVSGPRGSAPDTVPGRDTLVVPVGQCVFVPSSSILPYAGLQTITELPQAGYAVSTATVADASMAGPALSGSSIGAYVSSDPTKMAPASSLTTVVSFTNVAAVDAAPVTASAPAGGSGGGGGGSSSDPAPAAPVSAPAPQAPAPTVVAPAVVKTKAILKSSLSASHIKNHRVIVRVVGSAQKATIRVTLYNAQHKVLRSVLRSVATNRAVVVPNLKLGPAVKHYKVKVL